VTAFHDRRPGMPPLASPRRDPTTLSRVDAAYRQLRAAIISGEYPPGAPLRHSELADAFGVSLIPIREAMRRLEVERLVESIPNKGSRVAPVSIEDVQDVYATRVLLEVEALRRAWPRLDAAAVGEVRALCDSMVERVRRSDRKAYDLHRQVHFALYERCGSPWLLHMIEIVWSHTERYRRLAAKIRRFVDDGADLHGVVLDAVSHGDLEAAIDALRRDLERTANLMVEAYESET
jgi:GntR family transcriptional regulator, carbon starvation induced regulator